MQTLYIDRSTAAQSAALYEDGSLVSEIALSDDWCPETIELLDGGVPDRIVAGVGPGSFAGIRSVLAFAHGCAIGGGVELRGMVSPAAFAREGESVAVVGDSRRGKFWVALFDGFTLSREIFQTVASSLVSCIPPDSAIVSPDHARIGDRLGELFGPRYSPAPPLAASALCRAASANPALLITEPLPLYLNPAVRDDL